MIYKLSSVFYASGGDLNDDVISTEPLMLFEEGNEKANSYFTKFD